MAMTFPSNPTTGQQYSVSGGPTYTWDGTVWKILTPGSQFSEQQFTATAGQTTFTVSGGYVIGAVDVYRNGVKLVIGLDFTATDLSTVVLTNAASAGDTIEVVKAAQILYADALRRTGDTMTGPLTLGGLLDTGATGQIKFPAAQNASADANTLDDYEEGSCSLRLSDGTASGGAVGSYYTKIGNLVSITFQIYSYSTQGFSTTSILKLTGLPFPVLYISESLFSNPNASNAIITAEGGNGVTSLNLMRPNGANYQDWSALTLSSLGAASGATISLFGTLTYKTN